MVREEYIERLNLPENKGWDVIIIGGGATGLGIALDASSRGYKTLLLEQSDFAKGTSSRSTKLVHGGVRYLAQGDLMMVVESLHERGIFLKNASHLLLNQEFVIPVYTRWDAFLYTMGLKFYDFLAGSLSMGKSYFINREETMSRLPQLKAEGLRGGVVYHDGQFDDARMAIALAKSTIEAGGLLLNYFKVSGFLKNKQNKIHSVIAMDMISGIEYKLEARLVINATGIFADDIAKLDNPKVKNTLRPSQGVHIVLDQSFLNSSSAIMIPKTDDGRVLFAIPWYNEVLIGTTDTPIDEVKLEPIALESEIDFILKTAGKYMTRTPQRKDVLSVFAGLRPLAANPSKPESTREVSRRHKIILSSSGLLTIIGGKWTTYRIMAKETIDRAIKSGMLEKRKCITSELRISKQSDDNFSDRLCIYNEGAFEIENMIKENPEFGLKLVKGLPYTKAEIIWICRNEMPVNIEDILARRTRSLFLNANASSEMAPIVADIMAKEMAFSSTWIKEQVEAYKTIAKAYF